MPKESLPPTEPELWRGIEKEVGWKASPAIRQLPERLGLVDHALRNPDPARRASARNRIVEILEGIRQVQESEGTVVDVEPDPRDPRWALLGELSAKGGIPLWQPPRFRRGTRWSDTRTAYGLKSDTPTVELRFDYRMSLAEVQRLLRRRWPSLVRSKGMLRSSQRIKPGAAELVRLVCLDMPSASWPKRWQEWRRRGHQEYKDHDSLRNRFHQLEEQLTGQRHGLAAFYMPIARRPISEVYRAASDLPLADGSIRPADPEAVEWARIYDDRAVERLKRQLDDPD